MSRYDFPMILRTAEIDCSLLFLLSEAVAPGVCHAAPVQAAQPFGGESHIIVQREATA